MDTRTKIVSADAALGLASRLRDEDRKLVVVTGAFDVLLASHALHLRKVRADTGAAVLMVVLTPVPAPLLPQRARAELVAALHMVDYVVTAGEEFLSRFPANVGISRHAADEEEMGLLREHVHRRHSL